MKLINKDRETDLIESTSGKLKGYIYNGVEHYLGIKYGEAKRFQKAEPYYWSGIYEAKEMGAFCYQPHNEAYIQSEDCLNLNIWRKTNSGLKKPVLVYIHGGSYMKGSASENNINGHNFSKNKDIIIVNINYRLGVFGFLDFSYVDEDFESNLAIKDMELALKWVKNNIEKFGGDPNNITISGESAGGTSVMLIYTLKQFEDYFDKAIIMSGISSYFIPVYEAHYRSDMFLEYIGSSSRKDDLLRLDAKLIADKTFEFSKYIDYGASLFCPVIDGEYIDEFPLIKLRNGDYKPKPLLIGVTKDEMSMLNYSSLSKEWGLDNFLQEGLAREDEEYKKEVLEIYKKYNEGMDVYRQIYSDLIIKSGSVWYADESSKKSDVWMYRLDYYTKASEIFGLKAFHASDLPILFGNYSNNFLGEKMFSLTKDMSQVEKLTKEMQRDYYSFITRGKVDWPKVREHNYPSKCYDLTSKVENIIELELIDKFKESNYYDFVFRPFNKNIRYRFPIQSHKKTEDLQDLIKLSNIFNNIKSSNDEIVELVYEDSDTRIERIISKGQTTTWQTQEQDEFIYILQGSATVETREELVRLEKGDGLKIPANSTHRVSWTNPKEETVWLCFYQKSFLDKVSKKINPFK